MVQTTQNPIHNQILKKLKTHGVLVNSFIENDTIFRSDVSLGKDKCCLKSYTNGTFQIQGKNSQLKQKITELKDELEKPMLSQDFYTSYPQIIQQSIPNIDPIVLFYFKEAVLCLENGLIAPSAMMLGVSSELLIRKLINTFSNAIEKVENRTKFNQRTKKYISKAYDEFKASYNGCKTKPDSFEFQDIEIKLEAVFQFTRICRNKVGHPIEIPTFKEEILIGNMAHFTEYINDVYKLIDFYNNNTIKV